MIWNGWKIHSRYVLKGFQGGKLQVRVGAFDRLRLYSERIYQVDLEGPGEVISAELSGGPKDWSPKGNALPREWTPLTHLDSEKNVSFSYCNSQGTDVMAGFYVTKPVYFVKGSLENKNHPQ